MILGFIPILGQLLGTFLAYALQTAVMFAIFHIVERNMEFMPAAQASFDTVKQNFWPFLGLQIVASILGMLGAFACCIGIVVTMPIATCILAIAYRDVYGSQAAQPPAPDPVAPAAPAV
jgi:uncharacterized membrane protein